MPVKQIRKPIKGKTTSNSNRTHSIQDKAKKPISKYDIPTLVKQLNEYVDKCIAEKEAPILKEFTVLHNLSYQYLTNLRVNLEAKDRERLNDYRAGLNGSKKSKGKSTLNGNRRDINDSNTESSTDSITGLDREIIDGDENHTNQLSLSIKRLIDCKEYLLERNGLNGKYDRTVTIFSLKQLGWRDEQIIDIGEATKSCININIVKASSKVEAKGDWG